MAEDLECRAQACAEMLRAACVAEGTFVSADGRVSEEAAAELLGVTAGTLRNWRAVGLSPAWYRPRPGAKATYRLADLGRFIEAGRVAEGTADKERP